MHTERHMNITPDGYNQNTSGNLSLLVASTIYIDEVNKLLLSFKYEKVS